MPVERNGHHEGNGKPPGPPKPPADIEPPPESRDDLRPIIIISTEEHHVIDQAVEALSADGSVYQRGNMLATVLRDATGSKKQSIERPKGTPRIATMPLPRLRELLTKNARWIKIRKGEKGGFDRIPAHPPDWAASAVASRGEWPQIRPIGAVIESPALRHDGSVLDVAGWDEETSLLYEPNADFPPIPKRPDRDQARKAAAELLYLVTDFPFAGDAHKAAWLAALLTPLARFAIEGPCPLFPIDANSPATGKSKLTDIISVISTGRDMPRTAYPDSDEEMRKRITSIALAGDRLMLLDNIASTFGGSALDSALTGMTWRDRSLGKLEMTPELPLFAVWYATGNNLTFRGDVLRRVVPCRLETKEERPEDRTEFTIKGDLIKHVRSIRPRLVAAALTLLRAHAVAGRPRGGLGSFASYDSWSEVVRSAVHWATDLDPCQTREELRASDPETIARAALIEGWATLPGASRGVSVAEALRLIKADPERLASLRDALMEWSKRPDELPSARVVGNRLKAIRGRVVNGKYLESKEYQGTQEWRVVTLADG